MLIMHGGIKILFLDSCIDYITIVDSVGLWLEVVLQYIHAALIQYAQYSPATNQPDLETLVYSYSNAYINMFWHIITCFDRCWSIKTCL